MACLSPNAPFGLCEKLKRVVAFVLQPCNHWSGLLAPEKERECAVTRRSCGGGSCERKHAPVVFCAKQAQVTEILARHRKWMCAAHLLTCPETPRPVPVLFQRS